jgi:hypothetical protein
MSFSNFIQLQNDMAHALLSEPWFENINIVTRDKLLTTEALARLPDKTLAAEVLVYITPRNGRKGCGIIVGVPEWSTQSPNVTGPQGDIIIPFLVLEDAMLNESPTLGTLKPADQVAQKIMDLLHLDADDGTGTLAAVGAAISPARDWEPLRAFNVRLKITMKRQQTARVGPVTIAIDAGLATLTCPTVGAQIYWTLDGTFPGLSNSKATIYSSPFAVASGDPLRAGAYLTDYNPGPRRSYTVP